jgi:uncharacterized protein with FMN-binding domain
MSRRALSATLATLSLAVPATNAANAFAAARTTQAKKVVVATRTFTGSTAEADRWGELEVTVVVRKTTTTVGTKKTVTRRITSIKVPIYPNHTNRSIYINQNALPMLVQESLKAQSAHIYIVSGATDTSDAFAQSLQAAILKERAW